MRPAHTCARQRLGSEAITLASSMQTVALSVIWIVATMSRIPSQRPRDLGPDCAFRWRVRRTTWSSG